MLDVNEISMQELVASLIKLGCWLAIAASPTLIGIIVGAFSFWYFGKDIGLILALVAVTLGLVLGAMLANYAAKRGALVEFASGQEPPPRRGDQP